MAEQITNYKCPACTGPLRFDGASGKLVCDYCDSVYEVQEIESLYAEQEEHAQQAWDTSGLTEDWGTDGAHMRTYSCPSCGAELICEETTVASSCPYCGNAAIVPGQFMGSLRPEFIIPFKQDQKQAREALTRYYKGKVFLPKAFADENRISEIRGIYVPFWLFDAKADASARFEATRSHTIMTEDYEIIRTEHYQVDRAGEILFDKVPVDAATRMPDEHMDAIEPYLYEELKPFSSAYLPGFLADKYDVSKEESMERADVRMERSALDVLRADVSGYDTCTMISHHVDLKRGEIHYAMLPVYMLNTKWNGEDCLFAMNGQTGKFIGNLPIDYRKYWSWFAAILAVMTLILGTVLLHTTESALQAYGFGLIGGAVVAFLICQILKSQMRTAVRASGAMNYVQKNESRIQIRRDRFTHCTEVRHPRAKKTENGR